MSEEWQMIIIGFCIFVFGFVVTHLSSGPMPGATKREPAPLGFRVVCIGSGAFFMLLGLYRVLSR